MPLDQHSPAAPHIDTLASFVDSHQPLFVLTGAGCSTDSGLADYRDQSGQWKRPQPITKATFVDDTRARKRYWLRSAAGWPVFAQATPNAAHRILAKLQHRGYLQQLVTQNVDGLHQRAGHRDVIDLHGQLSTVSCLSCGQTQLRDDYQRQLIIANPGVTLNATQYAPDGDAELNMSSSDTDDFNIPDCHCGGMLKPDVVFFGENVPAARVRLAMDELQQSSAVLVIGSSLMVYSGYRFCKRAHELDLPIASLTQGVTRADALLKLNVQGDCATALDTLDQQLP